MGATILRQWLVLTMLPRPPRRIDTASIEQRLRERGIAIHRRTIQRDLVELANVFPIVADERAKPYGWRWLDEANFIAPLSAAAPAPSGSGIEVSLRLPRASLIHVLRRLGARNQRQFNGPDDGPLATVIVTIDDGDWTRRLLLGHGDEVEVVAPRRLRQELAERAGRALALHAR